MSVLNSISGRIAGLKIRTQLTLAFLTVLSLMFGLGVYSTVQLSAVNAISSELAHNWMPLLGDTTSMRASVIELRELETKYARTTDVSYLDEYEEKLKAVTESVNTHQSTLVARLSTSAGNELTGKFAKTWQAYQASIHKVVSLVKSQKNADALEISEGIAKSDFDDAILALDQLTAYGFEEGSTVANEARSLFENARMLNIGLLAGAVLIGTALAILITHSLRRQLGGEPAYAAQVAHSVVSGQFSMRIETEAGDTSSLVYVMKSMRDALANIVGDTANTMGAAANGDLSGRITADAPGEFARLKDSVNHSLQSMDVIIANTNKVMTSAANGELSKRIDTQARGDFDKLKSAVNQSLAAMQSIIVNTNEILNAAKAGDLSQRIDATTSGDFTALKDGVNQTFQDLSVAMKSINQNTRLVAIASGEASQAIAQIADGAQNQTMMISQVTEAIRQTADSVADVSRNTAETSTQSRHSIEVIQNCMARMEQMVEIVRGIEQNSVKINKITEVIEGIANKTNLLSLNAAIEAARAGEHGKGFSVVAEEVGKLAASSAQSSQEIAILVQHAVSETALAVTTVNEVSLQMHEIERNSRNADAMLERISAAMEQQSAGVEEVKDSLMGLDKIAHTNSAASEQITASIQELSRNADQTRKEVDRFVV